MAAFIDAIERNVEYSGYHGSQKQIVKFNFKPYYKDEETEEVGEVKGEVDISNDKTKLSGSVTGKIFKTKPKQVGFSFSVNREDKEDSTDKQNYVMGFYYPEAMRLKIYLQTILMESYKVEYNPQKSSPKEKNEDYDF